MPAFAGRESSSVGAHIRTRAPAIAHAPPQAERRLAEEVERVKHYLDATTEPKITRVVENELLREQVRGRGRGGGAAAGAGAGMVPS